MYLLNAVRRCFFTYKTPKAVIDKLNVDYLLGNPPYNAPQLRCRKINLKKVE